MSCLLDPTALKIISYPHPTLSRRSKPVRRVDAELRAVVSRMFELMYEHRGIGLAANQVDLPLRLFVINLEGNPEEGEEWVFINPVLSRPKGSEEADEGCLSLPELWGPVTRPKRIHVSAFDLSGTEISLDLDGLFARAVQHEYDHLEGVVFPERMHSTSRAAVESTLDEFSADFASRRRLGEIPGDEEIEQRLREWEERYC